MTATARTAPATCRWPGASTPAATADRTRFSLGADHAFNITKDELKTGDILIDDVDEAGSDFRHVVLFEKWANDAHTSA